MSMIAGYWLVCARCNQRTNCPVNAHLRSSKHSILSYTHYVLVHITEAGTDNPLDQFFHKHTSSVSCKLPLANAMLPIFSFQMHRRPKLQNRSKSSQGHDYVEFYSLMLHDKFLVLKKFLFCFAIYSLGGHFDPEHLYKFSFSLRRGRQSLQP